MNDTTTRQDSAGVIRDLAFRAAGPHLIEPGCIYTLTGPDGRLHQVDLTADQYLEFPQRKRGTTTVRDVASFAQYHKKHADAHSEVYADLDLATVTAVLDAHRPAEAEGDDDFARWQQHRLIMELQLTQPWQDWTGNDRRWMTQLDFAEFLEEHARDIDPGGKVTSADLLESAQHFQAKLKVAFTSGKRLRDGQTQFEHIEQIESAGRSAPDRGTIEMPSEFDLAIMPFEDCAPRPVAVRLRFRIRDDKSLVLGYFMNDPVRIAREAVSEVVGKLEAECGVTVMHGRPA